MRIDGKPCSPADTRVYVTSATKQQVVAVLAVERTGGKGAAEREMAVRTFWNAGSTSKRSSLRIACTRTNVIAIASEWSRSFGSVLWQGYRRCQVSAGQEKARKRTN